MVIPFSRSSSISSSTCACNSRAVSVLVISSKRSGQRAFTVVDMGYDTKKFRIFFIYILLKLRKVSYFCES